MAEKEKKRTVRNPKNHYDIAIWGANLPGLILAAQLSNSGKKVLLVEEKDCVGGHLAPTKTLKGLLKSNIDIVPANDEYRKEFQIIEKLLDRSLILGETEVSPVTFEKGELKSFTGFGSRPFHSAEILDFYNTQTIFNFNGSPEKWLQEIFENFTGETLFKSEVTDILISNGQIESIIVNGAKSYTAEIYINSSSPKTTIRNAVPYDSVSAKMRHKISRAHFWTSVCLHYSHPCIISENNSPHFLMGNKTDNEPCLGRFIEPTEAIGDKHNHLQQSIWTSFIPSEAAEDDDFVGGVIRHMKKQIKRAYPEIFEHISNEKITIHSDSHGQLDLSLKKEGQLPKISNYWLASGFLAEKPNIIGSLQQARLILEQISEIEIAEDKALLQEIDSHITTNTDMNAPLEQQF